MAENRECSSASGCSKESCEGCSGSEQKTSFAADMNRYSSVKKVIWSCQRKRWSWKILCDSILSSTDA